MNILSNLYFILRVTNVKLAPAILGELLHSMFITVPTGILLFIIWDLFDQEQGSARVWGMVLILVIMFFCQMWIAKHAMIRINNVILDITSRLRLMLGDHLHQLSLGFYKSRESGDIASVLLQDVSNFESIFKNQFQSMISAFLGTLLLSIFLLILDIKLALFMIAAIPCSFVIMVVANRVARKLSFRHVASRNETGSRLIEYVQGIQYLKAFNLTGQRFSSLKTSFEKFRKNSLMLEAGTGPLALASLMFFDLFFLLMLLIALPRLALTGDAALSIPILIAFMIIGQRFYTPIQLLMMSSAYLNYMNVSMERIRNLLEAPLQDKGKKLCPDSFTIAFENVSFSYTDRQVLQNINLTIPEKCLTALVGPSGAGKTSITNLITRFWDPQQGRISIGGIDISHMSPQTVYSLISQVFQDVYLFDDTIYNNIKIGKLDATKEEVEDAMRKAQVIEFLDTLENGIYTKVGEGGSRLSGGQKQRISIARAILKNAPIILLDEATSALDPENEIYIQQAIQELVKEKTVVVIAHKLQTIRNANKIIVMEKGLVVETGTHQELLDSQNLYSQYWHIQQSSRGWKIGLGK